MNLGLPTFQFPGLVRRAHPRCVEVSGDVSRYGVYVSATHDDDDDAEMFLALCAIAVEDEKQLQLPLPPRRLLYLTTNHY